MFGFLNINKPKNMTSHDVVSQLRQITKIKHIGHAGTLDPMATGVLPVAIGKCTRLIEYLSDGKIYISELAFGKKSDTYDITGQVEDVSANIVNIDDLKNILNNFIGEIEQKVPMHSAVHYNGQRLYKLARDGIKIDDIPVKMVKINYINILNFDFDKQIAKLEIACNRGTYIRSLINDIGNALNTSAIMTSLIRTASAGFFLEDSISDFTSFSKDELLNQLILPNDKTGFQSYTLNYNQYKRVSNGNKIPCDADFIEGTKYNIIYDGKFIAIGMVKNKYMEILKVLI